MYALLYDFSGWVHRRVEYIDFIDDISVTRRVSIDFAVPQPLHTFELVNKELLPSVPLTFLLKGDVLRNFDLRDAEDNPVPMLTKEQNGRLAGDTLIYLAEEALGQRPLTGRLDPLQERLRLVAESHRELAQPEVASWSREARDEGADFRAELHRLVENPAFIEYAQTLAENYILFAVGPPEPNTRRLMKFQYEEPFRVGDDPSLKPGEKLPHWERLQERLGWRVKTVNLAMPAVNLAASFHVEIPAPPEMEVQIARLVFKPWEPLASEEEAADKEQSEPAPDGQEQPEEAEGVAEDGESGPPTPEDALDGPAVQRVHLYKAGVSGQFVADALIYLRARRAGFLRAAWLTGWLNFGLLVGGLVYLNDITASDNSQTAAALLLLGPTLLAGTLIRPGEHRMVASVLLGVRLMLMFAVLATVVAVGLLAGAATGVRCEVWSGATVVAGLAAIGLTISYFRPPARPKG
jgi:hypothetical protein